MRQGVVCMGMGLAICLIAVGVEAAGPSRGSYWPVNTYVAADSVLGRYYRQFVSQYGHEYANSTMTFKVFCQRLRVSDLLNDQFNRLGIPSKQVHAILRELETTHFATTERQHIRKHMLAIDLVLETIEGAITLKNRAEFRREVLAEIPPITSTG